MNRWRQENVLREAVMEGVRLPQNFVEGCVRCATIEGVVQCFCHSIGKFLSYMIILVTVSCHSFLSSFLATPVSHFCHSGTCLVRYLERYGATSVAPTEVSFTSIC